MASTLDVIPEGMLKPAAKAELIGWLRASQLPARFRRLVLQEWGEKVGATVGPEDYAAVVRKGEA